MNGWRALIFTGLMTAGLVACGLWFLRPPHDRAAPGPQRNAAELGSVPAPSETPRLLEPPDAPAQRFAPDDRWAVPGAMARLPGGGLPLTPCPAVGTPAEPDVDSTVAPRRLPAPWIPTAEANRSPLRIGAPRGAPPSNPSGGAPRPNPFRPTAEPADADFGRVRSVSFRSVPFGQAGDDTLALMRQYALAADAASVAQAEAELARRGFGAVHFDLARRLFDARPDVRRGLARALPGLASVDPAPWLLWLCRDADAEVRLSAVTLLATATDPQLLAEVERLARTDPDPRIQRCAERLAPTQPMR